MNRAVATDQQRRRGWTIALGAMSIVAMSIVVGACGGAPASDAEADAGPAGPDASAADSADVEVRALERVVTTDAPLADLIARVAGPEVDVVSIVPHGRDGHTYEPVPSDAQALADADVFIESGMGLNEALAAFAAVNLPAGAMLHELSAVIPPAEVIAIDTPEQIAEHGHAHEFNAHFWPDPVYAQRYVERIAEILAETDPADAEGYRRRAIALIAELATMHDAFIAAIATIPAANRTLVVYHDAWSYYGRRYGLPVIGAVQPSDFSEPSAAEVVATIEAVRASGVPAFFGSEVFPTSVLETVEAETGARYVADLSDDRLPGDPGDPEHSYVGMMVANTRAIVDALGGDTTVLDGLLP